jgi:hypothetical protein
MNLLKLTSGGVSMQPKTEGLEEQGPSRVPFINDPQKPSSKSSNRNGESVEADDEEIEPDPDGEVDAER